MCSTTLLSDVQNSQQFRDISSRIVGMIVTTDKPSMNAHQRDVICYENYFVISSVRLASCNCIRDPSSPWIGSSSCLDLSQRYLTPSLLISRPIPQPTLPRTPSSWHDRNRDDGLLQGVNEKIRDK